MGLKILQKLMSTLLEIKQADSHQKKQKASLKVSFFKVQ